MFTAPITTGTPLRNTARYCDGLVREFTVCFEDAFTGRKHYAAIAGQICSDPLDCIAMTEAEAAAHCDYLVRRADPRHYAPMGVVIPLPEGWSND